jgi:hypothetical protein
MKLFAMNASHVMHDDRRANARISHRTSMVPCDVPEELGGIFGFRRRAHEGDTRPPSDCQDIVSVMHKYNLGIVHVSTEMWV